MLKPLPLRDGYGRVVTYLRVSVTDRCNLRCFYCLPREHGACAGRERISLEQLRGIVEVAATLGVTKIRITGGEPLVRPGIVGFVQALQHVSAIDDLALSTNGTLLADHAEALRQAGLKRVNISLDSLRPDVFRAISGRNDLDRVLAGIDAARAAGLTPIKLNVVAIRGVNDDELPGMIEFAAEHSAQVRFIEYMPLGLGQRWHTSYVPRSEILERIHAHLADAPPRQRPGDTATYYGLRGGGEVGVISPVSCRFCAMCNRLRLTADARLRPCLTSEGEVDLRPLLGTANAADRIAAGFRQATAGRPQQGTYRPDDRSPGLARSMAAIGG